MRKIVLALGMAMGMSVGLVACGGDKCSELADKYKSCWTAVDCAVITDATAKTTCETVKKGFTETTTTGGETVACEGTVATAAETCLTNFKENAPKAADTAVEVAKYCGCTG